MLTPTQRTVFTTTLISLVLAPMALTGCKTSDPRPYAGRADPVAAPDNNPRIVMSHPELMRSLGYDAPIVLRPDDLLTVGVPTRNLGDERYILDYRFTWYDANGLEIRPAMGWREVVLEPKGQKRLQANALDKRAVDWKMEVRWANR
jgi:uncharacterized protein YcfL